MGPLKCAFTVKSADSLPACSLPATTPLQTWPQLCPPCLGRGRHETPGLIAEREVAHYTHTLRICTECVRANHFIAQMHTLRGT